MIPLNVVLSTEAARALIAGASPPVLAALEGSGKSLVPQFPGAEDPDLARYQRVEADDEAEAERLQSLLLATPGVEGAYVEPPTELP